MYAQQSASLQSASGFAFQSSCCSSQPSFGASARVGAWSRRIPVIQQSRSRRARERLDLRLREIEVGLRVPEAVLDLGSLEALDRRAVAPLHLAPELVRLGEEVARVDREDARPRLELEEHVEQHRLLLLEGA